MSTTAHLAVESLCTNCLAALHGPYCNQCGQHVHASARSVKELVHDGWATITNLDGRIFRSMVVLLVRPGELTRAYFAGHRARYLPPVRLYLVLSVVFFGVSALVATSALKLDVEPGNCGSIHSALGWLATLLQKACVQNSRHGGTPVRDALLRDVPRMMILLVPLVAALTQVFYLRPRRLYVEHVVFFLHLHAAVFSWLMIGGALVWAATRTPGLGSVAIAGTVVTGAYLVWYIFRAMQMFYAQSVIWTGIKFVLLGGLYYVCLIGALGLTIVYSSLYV